MADQPGTSLQGYIDESLSLDGYGQLVDMLLEFVPELTWPMSLDTYTRMRHEPQLVAVRQAYNLAIRRSRWSVDGRGCRDEVTQFVADQLGLPVEGSADEPSGARRRNFTWAEHLRLALLSQDYGHMFFEQDYEPTTLPSGSTGWALANVQERMPHTVARLDLNDDGTLKAVVQRGRQPGNEPVITTADHRLVYYANDREGSNYFGRSILRPAYPLWLIKDQVLRVHATSIRRFGLGIPNVEAPAGATPQQIAEAQRIAATYKASENAGVGLPNGFVMKLAGLQGSVPDAVGFLTYLDSMITRYTLTGLLDMTSAQRGSRALGETVMDLMVMAQQAVADFHADTATGQIVVPLVDANWGEDEPAPRVCVGDVGADLELTAQDIYWLTAYAALTNDPQLEAWIRQRYGIPEIDPAYVRDPAPAVQPPAGGPASDG